MAPLDMSIPFNHGEFRRDVCLSRICVTGLYGVTYPWALRRYGVEQRHVSNLPPHPPGQAVRIHGGSLLMIGHGHKMISYSAAANASWLAGDRILPYRHGN